MLKESKEVMYSLGSAEKLGVRTRLQRFQSPEEKWVPWGMRGVTDTCPKPSKATVPQSVGTVFPVQWDH